MDIYPEPPGTKISDVQEFSTHLGGSAANTCVALSKLGVSSDLVTCRGAEISSLITEQCFSNLKGPVTRITTPHVPLPSADILEDNTIPSVDLIVNEVIKKVKGE